MNNEMLYQIALTLIPNIGPVQAKQLIEHFGNAESIFKAKKKDLSAVDGIGEIRAKQIKDFNQFKDAEDEITFTEKHHIQCLFLTNNDYPKRLLHCYDAPTILYYRGNANLNNSKIISIIGTRNNTDYGKQVTEDLITELIPYNVLVVSGLAYGIDAIAHKASIKNNVANVGVLAHGLDSIYPAQHKSLAKDILLNVPIVAHDAKVLLKELLTAGYTDLPEVHHDIAQGSFLLNPLRKSRALSDLIGIQVESPEFAISALWTLYEEQAKAMDGLPKIASVARTIDFPLIPVLARMEHRGITLDVNQLELMNTKITQDLTEVRAQMFEMTGYEFNIASPSQLAEVLFTKLQLPTTNIKRGKTGYSTGQSELDKLRGQHPIIESIEQYRELSKLQNTYVEALPKLVDKHGRIHTTFNQDVAATGRLSSTDPNLQNIPVRTELGRKIRDAFVPEKGNVFVNADYSQFELRLAAVLAGDEKMINDFNAGTDIHIKTAAEVYKVPLDNVTKAQRSAAKTVNFGVLYGMSVHGLAAATGMTFTEAKNFIDEYNVVRAKLVEYTKGVVKKAHEDGFVETLYGRRRPTPDVTSSNFVVRQAAERAAANMPIQGTEADLMKKAMVIIDEKIKGLGEQLLQVHDSILVECKKENAEKIAEILQDSMENIAPEIGVRLQVDVHMGSNWGEV